MSREKSLSNKITQYIIISGLFFGFFVMISMTLLFFNRYENDAVINTREKLERVKESFEKELLQIESGTENLSIQVEAMYEKNFTDATQDLNDLEMEIYTLLSTVLHSNSNLSSDIFVYLSPYLDGDVHDVWLTLDEAGRLYRNEEIPKERYDEQEDMAWYYDVERIGQGTWGDSYVNRYGDTVTAYIVPIYSHEDIVGVMGVYLEWNRLFDLLRQVSHGQDEYFWILDAQDNIIYHPFFDVGLTLEDIGHDIYGAGWDTSYSEGIVNKTTYRHFTSITKNQWKVIHSISERTIAIDKGLMFGRVTVLFFLLIVTFVLLNHYFMKPYRNRYDQAVSELKQNKSDGRYEQLQIEGVFDGAIFVDTINALYKEVEMLKSDIHNRTYYSRVTELPNWVQMTEDLNRILQENSNQTVSVLDIDLDYFKKINEILGHHIGDEILRELAVSLKKLETGDIRIYHSDGDAFIAIVVGVPCDEIHLVAEKVQDVVSAASSHQRYDVDLSCSIGIACYPDHASDSTNLLKYAEVGLYASKSRGRNCYSVFEERYYKELTESKDLEADIVLAIKENQFVVHYQPKYNVEGKVLGFEALVRWLHPKKGLLYPNYFIRYAEETGYIDAIGEIVLREACRVFKEMKALNDNLEHISVNLSSRQLLDHNFVENIIHVLEEESLQCEYLELEVTETMLIYERERSIMKLEALRNHGVMIALDDFGSGYASITNIKELPISRLKIDRSFIYDIDMNPRVIKMLGSVVSMAHDLDLEVTAEGVETRRQLTLLEDCDVDEFQGYYLAKPMAADHLKRYLTK